MGRSVVQIHRAAPLLQRSGDHMAIVVTDASSPNGQVRVTDTATGESTTVPQQKAAIADAVDKLKGAK